jgi:vancomycin resistance protein YoaR
MTPWTKHMTRKFYNIILLCIFVFLIVISPLVINFGKTGQKTTILNHDYSLLSKNEIINKISSDFPSPKSLVLYFSDRQFVLNLDDINFKIDSKKQANELLFRRLHQGLHKYINGFFLPKNFLLSISYDSQLLKNKLSEISKEIDKPFIPSEIYIDKHKKIQAKIGELGQKVNIEKLEFDIFTKLSYYQTEDTIAIPVETIGHLPDDKSVENTKQIARNLISKSIILNGADEKITISSDTLISWLDFNNTYKKEKVWDYVNNLATSIKKDPVDAVFQFENSKVLEFQASKKGYALESNQLVAILARHLSSFQSSEEKVLNIDLPLIYTEPTITNSEVNNLGIKELLGSGTSTFKHSSSIRNFNVEKGASIINRILVAPGDTFSFVKSLGQVTLDAGYKKAYIIRQGKTELDVGGGICQVSTTLFRAALNAGLKITERQAHAYRVGYYEEDSPPGYDATIFIPRPDLKFINDTPKYILIQSSYDGTNKKLTYNIYGTSDGRQVKIDNYRKWGTAPPPPDKYIDDPSLPVGKIIQDEQRIAGLKTAFDWTVTIDGNILHQQTFTSSYVPWGAVYRRGTGPNN